jgi:Golgi nucleoside diphosphatase
LHSYPSQALQDYLRPLLDFAIAVLHSKQGEWSQFPIYLKATAGMRTLDTPNRARVINAVRNIFLNQTYSPFYFIPEQARVISGEEEAIYGWTAVNFALGTLLEASEGSGTVVNPKLTYGALDLGGASTQISFYEANEDIMSNLFKLQIGQGKHWNVYAHSFLYFGINEAWNRFGARLVLGGAKNEYKSSVYNPCLPGGSSVEFSSSIHFDKQGVESWQTNDNVVDMSTSYTATLRNDNAFGDFEKCSELVRTLLAKDQNSWCNFAHHGDCSVSHVYQPRLPLQQDNFGEFFAFTNFYRVWVRVYNLLMDYRFLEG